VTDISPRRGLHQRHIQMIALAGTIGTVGSKDYIEVSHTDFIRAYS